MDFTALAQRGYGPSLIPVIPPDGEIDYERSKDPEQIEKTRGKNPGKRLRSGKWVGFYKFTTYEQEPDDLERWTRWGAGAGLLAKKFPAFDIDVSDEAFVRALLPRIQEIAGARLFGRVGRRPRILLPFAAAPGYVTRKVRLPLDPLGLDENGRAAHVVELLGDGQHYVIEGIHPKTGAPYSWGARGLPSAADLPVLDADKAEAILAVIAEMAGVQPPNRGATTRPSTEVQVTVPAQDFSEVAAALNAIPVESLDYDGWVRSGMAVKALAGEAGRDLWVNWSLGYPENTLDGALSKWSSFVPPFVAGWDTLRGMAPAEATSTLAAFDFTEVAQPASALDEMYERYIWVQRIEQAFDRQTREMLTQLQFNVRNNHLGAPTSKHHAWGQWLAHPTKLKRTTSLTYRPGLGEIVEEGEGPCVNTYRAPDALPADAVTDDDIAPWLELVAFLLPDPIERETALNWLSAVVQRPNEKPNWHLVLGSTGFGMGKDLMLEPVRRAIGRSNAASIQPEQLLGAWTDWYESKRLIVVAEMQSFGKRELETKLRPYLAAPPNYISINRKHMNTYEVPNIAAFIFLTNKPDALPISQGDRRYFVTWNDGLPRSEEYYRDLVAWLENGGCDKAAAWLMSRDIAAFNFKGRAPQTEAKSSMQGLTLSALESWIRDGIEDESGVFATDLVEIGDVLARMPKAIAWNGATERRMAQHIKECGGMQVGRGRLGRDLPATGRDRGRLYAVRRRELYVHMDWQKLVEQFWKQRDKLEKQNAGEITDGRMVSKSSAGLLF